METCTDTSVGRVDGVFTAARPTGVCAGCLLCLIGLGPSHMDIERKQYLVTLCVIAGSSRIVVITF